MPTQTQSDKVAKFLTQFNGLGFKSKQLIFLILLEDLRSNVPRSDPARKLLDEIAGLAPGNRLALKRGLGAKRELQNRPVKKHPVKPRSPPTPLAVARRAKNASTIAGGVSLARSPPKWYYGPHYTDKRRI